MRGPMGSKGTIAEAYCCWHALFILWYRAVADTLTMSTSLSWNIGVSTTSRGGVGPPTANPPLSPAATPAAPGPAAAGGPPGGELRGGPLRAGGLRAGGGRGGGAAGAAAGVVARPAAALRHRRPPRAAPPPSGRSQAPLPLASGECAAEFQDPVVRSKAWARSTGKIRSFGNMVLPTRTPAKHKMAEIDVKMRIENVFFLSINPQLVRVPKMA